MCVCVFTESYLSYEIRNMRMNGPEMKKTDCSVIFRKDLLDFSAAEPLSDLLYMHHLVTLLDSYQRTTVDNHLLFSSAVRL